MPPAATQKHTRTCIPDAASLRSGIARQSIPGKSQSANLDLSTPSRRYLEPSFSSPHPSSQHAVDVHDKDTLTSQDIHQTTTSSMSPSHKRKIPVPSRLRSKPHLRKKTNVRPERKSAVRREPYDLDHETELGVLGDEDEDESELSDVPPSEENSAAHSFDLESSPEDALDHSDSDADMAAKLRAAGDGESLLGSGESGDEQEDDEERYIIADAVKAERKAVVKGDVQRRQKQLLLHRHPARLSKRASRQFSNGADEVTPSLSDFGSLSPETMRSLGLPVLEDELFTEQPGFHSDSEPSFTDFFASGDEGAEDHPLDDDDELTSIDDSTSQASDEDDISDIEDALMGEPLLAHVGDFHPGTQTAEQLDAAVQAGAEIARQDIPLLVIEDLDGRLIYARAGDGEAVFGSDGEFEFVDDSGSDDESLAGDYHRIGLEARDPRWATSSWGGQAGVSGNLDDDGDVFEDEGDTTDELPDEDMPFPRLLVGSVDPRGGRTSRRARAMAAQLRRLSPNTAAGHSSAARRGHRRTDSNVFTEDGTVSNASPPTPATDIDLPLPSTDVDNDGVNANGTRDEPITPTVPATPSGNAANSISPSKAETPAIAKQPEMGCFMPSSSKSVHRAVIDGSRPAASPFTSKISLQRKGLAGKRRSRRSSLTSSHLDTIKRARHDSPMLGLSQTEELSEAPSSPEVTTNHLPMELDDVVDASLLWRSGDSSDTGADGMDSDAMSESTAGPSNRRGRSTTDNIGLNVNAFSRWRKIPMGAFRHQQQSGGRGDSSRAGEGSGIRNARVGGGEGSQAIFGNYLLQRVGGSAQHDRRQDRSPFRRVGSHNEGSLHMVVPSHHTSSSDRRADSFIVSPVLWPVRPSSNSRHSDFALPATASYPSIDDRLSQDKPPPQGGKMTKREKRERKAQRAALRAAARAEKTRAREEALAATVDHTSLQGPSTPQPSGNQLLSPTAAMPHLSITAASPRASPSPVHGSKQPSLLHQPQELEQTAAGKEATAAASHQPWSEASRNPQQMMGNTPPTRAVTGNGHVPSLPSSTFGPLVTSPLFGGLFAPLNIQEDAEGDGLEGHGEAPALQI